MARRILELAELRPAMRRGRVFHDRRNPLNIFDDAELVKRYRFLREGIMAITDIVAPDIEHPTRRNYPPPVSAGADSSAILCNQHLPICCW